MSNATLGGAGQPVEPHTKGGSQAAGSIPGRAAVRAAFVACDGLKMQATSVSELRQRPATGFTGFAETSAEEVGVHAVYYTNRLNRRQRLSKGIRPASGADDREKGL